MTETQATPSAIAEAGKYLTFILDGGHYGVPILAIREIIAVQPVTPLPRMPEAMNGVINLRGRIIPVADLRTALDLTAREADRATCIIVLDIEMEGRPNVHIGGIVDAVSEVRDITADEIQPVPAFGGDVRSDFIRGLAKSDDENHVVTLLDLQAVLSNVLDDSVILDSVAGAEDEHGR